MIKDYEDRQKPKLPRRKLAEAVLDNQKNFICLSQLRANAVFGHELSWPMLTELKRVKTLEASTELIQKLDAQLQLWLEDVTSFIAGDSPLFPSMEKERRDAVHEKYIQKVRESHPTDPLFQALVHRGLIQARKVLYQHKHEQLEGGRVAELGGDVKVCIKHMENNNDAMERLHGINNNVNSKYAKRGFRNAEGIGMAKAVDLTAAIERGEISDKLIELAARMAARHYRKHGSQTAEKMAIDGKYKDEEDAILNQRRKFRAAKQAKMDEAEALMMLTDVDLMMKLKVEELKIELRAWQLWAVEHKKDKECRTVVSGCKADLQVRLRNLINSYGVRVKAVQDKARAQEGASATIARTLGMVQMIDLDGLDNVAGHNVDEDTLQAMEGITDGNKYNDHGEQGFASGCMAKLEKK